MSYRTLIYWTLLVLATVGAKDIFAHGVGWSTESIDAFWGNHPHQASISSSATLSKSTSTSPTHPKGCITDPQIRFFMYHYIRDDDPHDAPTTRSLSVTPQNFENQMKTVAEIAKRGKVTLMPGDDFLSAIEKRCFPSKTIWIFTSDDGWVDSYDTLAPIAKKYGVPFFLGIISAKVGQPGFVSLTQVQELAKSPLFTIASHTVNHRELTTLTEKEDYQEICQSKTELEKMIGKSIHTFVYPVGKIGKTSVAHLKQCGYTLAWSTNFGRYFDWKHENYYTMNRLRITHDTSAEYFQKLSRD